MCNLQNRDLTPRLFHSTQRISTHETPHTFVTQSLVARSHASTNKPITKKKNKKKKKKKKKKNISKVGKVSRLGTARR